MMRNLLFGVAIKAGLHCRDGMAGAWLAVFCLSYYPCMLD
ncbi:hypothetical protein P308_05615 [Pseudomonas piscis]|nr:hypothetical protein P308_05615 [Pseudomonas piscis]